MVGVGVSIKVLMVVLSPLGQCHNSRRRSVSAEFLRRPAKKTSSKRKTLLEHMRASTPMLGRLIGHFDGPVHSMARSTGLPECTLPEKP